MKPRARFFASALLAITLLGCGGAQERESGYLERGKQLFEKGDYAKARIQFRNAMQINPHGAIGHYYIGLIEENQRNMEGAFFSFLRATELDPENRDALIKVSNYLFAGGDIKQSQKYLDILLSLEPQHVEGLALQAAIALRQQQFDTARASAEQVLSLSPGNKGAISVLTGLHLSQGNVARAIQILDTGIAANRNDAGLLMLRARIFTDQNDKVELERSLRAVLEAMPDSRDHRTALASLLAEAGRLDEADQAIRAGIQATPDSKEMKMLLVGFLKRYHSYDLAVAELRRQTDAHADDPDYPLALAELFESHGDTGQASAVLEQMVERYGKAAAGLDARSRLARLKAVTGDIPGAGQLVAAVLAVDVQHEDALLVKGGLSLDQGDVLAAITDLRSILRTAPHHPQALRLLAEAHRRNGDNELALDVLKILAQLDPEDEEVRLRLAEMLRETGVLDEARGILDAMIQRRPDMALAWVALARLAIIQGDWALVDTARAQLAKLPHGTREDLHVRAEALAAQGKLADAAELYTTLLTDTSEPQRDDLALINFVDVSLRAGRTAAAAAHLTGLEQPDAKDPLLQLLLGRVRGALGRIADAERAYQQVIGQKPTAVAPYLELGHLLENHGQVKAALDVYDLGLRNKAEAKPLLLNRALAEERIGDIDKALKTYEALLDQDPNAEIAINNFAALTADRFPDDPKRLEKALILAERFRTSEDPLLLDTLAWVHHRLGQSETAAELLRRAKAATHPNPQLRFHWAAVLYMLGQTEEARLLLKTVASESFPGREEALKLIAAP